MHMLTGLSETIACAAIKDQRAVCVEAAHTVCDGVMIDYYCFGGKILRCEYDEDYDERRIEEVDGYDLKDFLVCHALM